MTLNLVRKHLCPVLPKRGSGKQMILALCVLSSLYTERYLYLSLKCCPTYSLVFWMRNVPHGLMCVNSCSPVGGTVWGDHGTFRRCSRAGEVCHWGWIWEFIFLFSLPLPSCIGIKYDQSASRPCHSAVPTLTYGLFLWNLKPKIKSPFSKLVLILELEVWVVVSCPVGAGTRIQASATAARALNSWITSPAPLYANLKRLEYQLYKLLRYIWYDRQPCEKKVKSVKYFKKEILRAY